MTVWATTTEASMYWPDAASVSSTTLGALLDVATEQVQGYAPASQWRQLTDAAITTGSPTLTSALGAFTAADVGRTVLGVGIPPLDSTIVAVTSATSVTLSSNASATATGLSVAVLPKRFRLACVYQARELYAASQRGEQDIIGIGDYAIRARPLTASVKQLLRPKRGVGAVG